jgi:hypothetical protein
LKVFENRVLRKIFGAKKKEIIGGWRQQHNEELHNLHTSPNKIRLFNSSKMKLAWHVARMGEKRNGYRFLVDRQNESDH